MSFQIQPSDEFDASLIGLAKDNYRKDKKGRELFFAILPPFFEDIEKNGDQSHFLSPEPWPPRSAPSFGWVLCKHRFRMPRLSGGAARGRIIVAINQPQAFIYPIMAYSHKQFEKRPPDRALASLLRSAIADANEIAKQQNSLSGEI